MDLSAVAAFAFAETPTPKDVSTTELSLSTKLKIKASVTPKTIASTVFTAKNPFALPLPFGHLFTTPP